MNALPAGWTRLESGVAIPPGVRIPKSARTFQFGYIDRQTNQRCPPQPKQAQAHRCPADYLFYGGAAFGGKSEFAIVEAVHTALRFPGCEVAIFRRKHTELQKSLIPRFLRLVPRWLAKFNKSDHCATFLNGSLLWFCHCQHEHDVYNYQSAEWLELLVDEASHFTEFQVRYLITRLRTSVEAWRRFLRLILTSNPGNVGHGWLKRWFIQPTVDELGPRALPAPGEVWRPRPKVDDPTPPEEVPTRCFIPARAEDNPAGMKADPTYLSRLWQLGGDKARQLALGDWDANESMIVGPDWKVAHIVGKTDTDLLALGYAVGKVLQWHVVHLADWTPPEDAEIYGSVDYGYGAPWSFHLHAIFRTWTGCVHRRTFFEFYAAKVRDEDQASRIAQAIAGLMQADGVHEVRDTHGAVVATVRGCGMARPKWLVCDPAMGNSRAEMGISKSILEVYQDALGPLGVPCQLGAKGRGARVSRPQRWKDALAAGPDGLPQWSVTSSCTELIRTVPEVPWDEEDPEVEDDESENHAYEDVGRFFEARPVPPRVKPTDELSGLDPISKAHQQARRGKTRKRTGLGKGLSLG